MSTNKQNATKTATIQKRSINKKGNLKSSSDTESGGLSVLEENMVDFSHGFLDEKKSSSFSRGFLDEKMIKLLFDNGIL